MKVIEVVVVVIVIVVVVVVGYRGRLVVLEVVELSRTPEDSKSNTEVFLGGLVTPCRKKT